ncbi:MAG: hypothetical protein SO170_01045 [Butyribacter sp.]|nr:hypothetical protein [bacterium]MDY3853536.1 hypothetical protein [Butyribacter sp.]
MNKSSFEIRALVEKISQKELLDFYDAFRQVTGYCIESPLMDHEYLQENKEKIIVAVRAILSAKLSNRRINKIIEVFEESVND